MYHVDEQVITYDKREWQLYDQINESHVLLVRTRATDRVWTLAPIASCEAPCPNYCEDGYIYIQIDVDDHRKELCPHCQNGLVLLEGVLR